MTGAEANGLNHSRSEDSVYCRPIACLNALLAARSELFRSR